MRRLATILVALSLAGCEPAADQPWVAFEGGGFVFNYRVAEAYYGFNLRPMRRIPDGTLIEVQFENPAGGPPLEESFRTAGAQLRYSFRSPGLHGIIAGRPYRVTVRLSDGGGAVLGTYERDFVSSLDQSALPGEPPVLGPGFEINPQSDLPVEK